MSSSSSDDEGTTIHQSIRNLYTQSRAGSSRRSNQHDTSDAEDDEDQSSRFLQEMDIEANDGITELLSELHLEQNRYLVPTDEDDDELRDLHEKIYTTITREPDDQRRRRLINALPASNCLREQVYYLRRKPTSPPASYFRRLNRALLTIVTRSFEESYRNVGTVLGVVEALAEVLILEVHVFGIPQNSNAGHHRSNRKLIANALTNLTFGQIHSKRRLCSYDGFISCVVRIILESPNITQVYAGLIRNLSWNADSGMSVALQPTVEALARAAVHAVSHDSDVTAILSALWNLAGHSVENKRTICDTPHCLEVLSKLLSPDAQFVSLVDSATGILKYVSQYLSTNTTHLDLRRPLISRMLTLLKSTSFTCVTNTLGAIANLIAKDPHMQQMIRQDGAAVQQLNVLRNSNRDDIRTAVKAVLNTLNQPGVHSRYGAEMSMSVGMEQMQTSSHHGYPSSPRLLSLRATRASPGRYIHPQQHHMQQMQIQLPQDQRSSSLPRHFAMQQNGGYPVMAQSYNSQMMFNHPFQQQQNPDDQQKQHLEQQIMYMQQQQQQFHQHQQMAAQQQPVEPLEDLDIPTTTVMGTRSNSERSLGSLNPGSVMTTGGWNSTLDTAANSSRALSPVSFSDIPASPTMCAQVFYGADNQEPQQNQQQQVQHSATVSSAQNTTHYSSGSANTMTKSSEGAATMPIDNLITPTYALLNPTTSSKQQKTSSPPEELDSPDDVLPVPGPSSFEEEEGDYAIVGGGDEDLLTISIQSEMPTSSSTPKQQLKVSPRLNGFFSPPLQKTSSPWNRSHSNRSSDADRLLMESIMSEMPRSRVLSPRAAAATAASGQFLEPTEHRRSHSKNEKADRRDAFIASHEPSDQHGVNGTRKTGSNTMQRMESLESQASSEDSFGLNGEDGDPDNTSCSVPHTMRIDEDDVDTSIPIDCDYDDDDYDYTNYTEYEGDEEEDPDATQFDEGIDPHLTIDCSMISSGSSLPRGETTTTSRDSKALATSTPKGSTTSIQAGGAKRATRVAINGKSRLPVPRTNGSLVDKKRPPPPAASNRPRLPPKPTLLKDKHYPEESIENQTTSHGDETIYANAAVVEAEEQEKRTIYMNALCQKKKTSSDGTTTPTTKSSAIVTPYNYQKSPFKNRSSVTVAEMKVEKPNPKQMLVTIV